jgi:hypothetical protein
MGNGHPFLFFFQCIRAIALHCDRLKYLSVKCTRPPKSGKPAELAAGLYALRKLHSLCLELWQPPPPKKAAGPKSAAKDDNFAAVVSSSSSAQKTKTTQKPSSSSQLLLQQQQQESNVNAAREDILRQIKRENEDAEEGEAEDPRVLSASKPMFEMMEDTSDEDNATLLNPAGDPPALYVFF